MNLSPRPARSTPVWQTALLSLSLTGLFASGVSATVLSDWNLAEVLRRADRVVVGKVVKQRTLLEKETGADTLMTESTVAVEETLKGRVAPTLVLSQIGGTHAHRSTDVVGDARLRSGDRVLLATYEHPDGRTYLVGMSLGAYWVVGDDLAQGHLIQNIEVPLIDTARARVRPPPGERVQNLKTVRALLAPAPALPTSGGTP